MSAGKGDTYRKVNIEKYNENYDKIFRKIKCCLDTGCKYPVNCKFHKKCLQFDLNEVSSNYTGEF